MYMSSTFSKFSPYGTFLVLLFRCEQWCPIVLTIWGMGVYFLLSEGNLS